MKPHLPITAQDMRFSNKLGRTTLMKRNYSILGLLFVAAYISSYLAMSLGGVYRPANIGLNGVKDWGWTPRGFTDQSGRLRVGLVIAFFPLYWVDSNCWHNDWRGLSGPRKMSVRPTRLPHHLVHLA